MKTCLFIATVLIAFSFSAVNQSQSSGRSFVASAGGIDVAYEVYGKGTTALIFVHGWSCDWNGQIEPFSRRFWPDNR